MTFSAKRIKLYFDKGELVPPKTQPATRRQQGTQICLNGNWTTVAYDPGSTYYGDDGRHYTRDGSGNYWSND